MPEDPIELVDVEVLGGEPTREREMRDRGRRTLRRLLDAGLRVVEERGYDEFRVDDVVDRAGHSHGTFYLYFRDREDLLRSLVRLVGIQLQPVGELLRGVPNATALSDWIVTLVGELDRHAEVLRAARALGGDEAVAGLVEPLARWFARLPGAAAPQLSARLLVWHVERAAVRDEIVDHDVLAAAVLRSVGSPSGPAPRADTELRPV